jgi:hypothetical protein
MRSLVYNILIDAIVMSDMDTPGFINDSKKVDPVASWRSIVDDVVAAHLTKIVKLAVDVDQSVNKTVQVMKEHVVRPEITGDFVKRSWCLWNRDMGDNNKVIVKVVNIASDKMNAIIKMVMISHSEIWRKVFEETGYEELADGETASWDRMKEKIWIAAKDWRAVSDAVDDMVQAEKQWHIAFENASNPEKVWRAALDEEKKAFQAAQTQNWDEVTSQAWFAATIKLSQETKTWEACQSKLHDVVSTLRDIMNVVFMQTLKAVPTWKQAYDEIISLKDKQPTIRKNVVTGSQNKEK